MSSDNTIYTDAPADVTRVLAQTDPIDDFLPSPDDLVLRTEKERITIAIDKHSLDLFRKYAHEHNAKYQSMINGVLSSYADKFLTNHKR